MYLENNKSKFRNQCTIRLKNLIIYLILILNFKQFVSDLESIILT